MHKEYMREGQFLPSKEFSNPKCASVIWELRVYPNGNNADKNESNKDEKERRSFIALHIINFNATLKAKYSIYKFDENEKRCYFISNETKDFKNNYGWGVNRYLDDNQIDGSVIIGCEVEFVPYNIEYEKNGIEESNVFNKSQNLFKNMLNQGTLSDCVIKIGNENIKAHRCILAQNSKVFLKMFEQNGMVEAQDGEIKIVDCSPEPFRAMLEYFYCGEIEKSIFENLVEELFIIAHKYEVENLLEICEQFMTLKIDDSSFSKRCLCAELYNLPKLEKACFNYLNENKKFLVSNEWKEFKAGNVILANKLLELALANC
ncbi:hypothetical protein ACQ4LE_000292 [Meloidogyne hapla]